MSSIEKEGVDSVQNAELPEEQAPQKPVLSDQERADLERKEGEEAIEAVQDYKDNHPPNGGWMAWLQVAGAFFLMFNTSGITNSFGVFQTYYEKHILIHEDTSRISWIGSLQACLTLFVGALTGPLFDMGYFRYLIALGGLGVPFALMMTSLCREYWQFMLGQSLTFGFSAACLFTPGMAIVSTYFTTKRAVATGIAASGASIGAVIYSILFRNVSEKLQFPWTARIIGFMALGTLAFSNAVMRQRVSPAHRRSLFAFEAFKDPVFSVYIFGILTGFMGTYIPYFHLTSYAMQRTGTDESLSFYLVSIMNAGSAVGRVVPNLVADRFGPFNTIMCLALCASVLAFGWMGIYNTPGICIFAVLYGFMTGGYVALPSACIASITPNIHEVGSRVGMCFLFAGLGMLFGSPIAGALVDLETSVFWKAQLCCAMLLIGSFASFAFARLLLFWRSGRKWAM